MCGRWVLWIEGEKMNPTIAGVQRLFEYVGNVGQWIRQHLIQETKVDVAGKVDVKVVLDLGPQLEGVIRDILTFQGIPEDPATFWARATRDLVRREERKFKALHQLGVSDITLGTEAITQRADAVPEEIQQVTVRYVERYVFADTSVAVSDWALPPSPLADMLETAERNMTKGDTSSLTGRLGVSPERPPEAWNRRKEP